MEIADLRNNIEALLFVSGEGLSESEVARGLGQEPGIIKTVLESLVDDYVERYGGILIRNIRGKYQFVTRASVHEPLKLFIQEKCILLFR